MSLASLASDPAVLACFDRVCALVCADGSGITLRQLSACHAVARALVAGDRERVEELAAELEIDAEALEGQSDGRP